MSRIGKQPIKIPDNVEVEIKGQEVLFKGPKGELTRSLPPQIRVAREDSEIKVVPTNQAKESKALWGLWRTLLSNAIIGVTQGFSKELELVGIGFRAEKEGNKLVLHVGFSHAVEYEIPAGVEVEVAKNAIKIEGVDKQLVGQVAAQIRAIKKPEPYKGKGIRYVGEEVKLKPGKAGKAIGTGGGN